MTQISSVCSGKTFPAFQSVCAGFQRQSAAGSCREPLLAAAAGGEEEEMWEVATSRAHAKELRASKRVWKNMGSVCFLKGHVCSRVDHLDGDKEFWKHSENVSG